MAIREYKAIFDVFREGKALTNSREWKQKQNLVNHLVALVSAGLVIAEGAGYHVIGGISEDQIAAIVGGGFAIMSVFNSIMTTITSTKVGIKDGTST